jgi:hypothetical protein
LGVFDYQSFNPWVLTVAAIAPDGAAMRRVAVLIVLVAAFVGHTLGGWLADLLADDDHEDLGRAAA